MSDGQEQHSKMELQNAAVIRGGRLIFQKLSLVANAGDIIWLRGANGSGKSTLLRLIAGLLPMAAGHRNITGKIALIDENLSLDGKLPLEDALKFWAKMDGASPEDRHSVLEKLSLTPLLSLPVNYLSSGQRKRAAIARLVSSGGDIWLLDEPYNALDTAHAERLDSLLLKHAQKGGIAIVAAHQPPSINVTDTVSMGNQQVMVGS